MSETDKDENLKSDSAIERAKEKYRNSDLGKAAKKRYDQSDLGKAARRRYLDSEKGKAALLRYYLSERAESVRQQHHALNKLFKKLDDFLKANPDKTTEDYFDSIKEDEG